MELRDRIKKIKVLAMDVDGVLTDGKIIVDSQGRETKEFDVQDGYAMVVIRRNGFKTAIISARASAPVRHRAKDLGVDKVYQDAYPKSQAYGQMMKQFKVGSEEVCYIGDDLPDLCILKKAGLAVAVANARREVKLAAHYVTKNNGGRGAVREVIELILKTQGKWRKIVQSYA